MTTIRSIASPQFASIYKVSASIWALTKICVVWLDDQRTALAVTSELDLLDDQRLLDIGLVRKTQSANWAQVARGFEAAPSIVSVYIASPRP